MKPFAASCRMYDPSVDRLRLTQEEYDTHTASGAQGRATFDYGTKMWNVEQRCDFATTDVAELRAHLETVHENKKRTNERDFRTGKMAERLVRINAVLPQRPMHPRWRGPALKDEGQRFKTKVEGVETCGTCGLVAEVGNRAADVLWWDEHQRLCVGAESAVA